PSLPFGLDSSRCKNCSKKGKHRHSLLDYHHIGNSVKLCDAIKVPVIKIKSPLNEVVVSKIDDEETPKTEATREKSDLESPKKFFDSIDESDGVNAPGGPNNMAAVLNRAPDVKEHITTAWTLYHGATGFINRMRRFTRKLLFLSAHNPATYQAKLMQERFYFKSYPGPNILVQEFSYLRGLTALIKNILADLNDHMAHIEAKAKETSEDLESESDITSATGTTRKREARNHLASSSGATKRPRTNAPSLLEDIRDFSSIINPISLYIGSDGLTTDPPPREDPKLNLTMFVLLEGSVWKDDSQHFSVARQIDNILAANQ
ncbi:hypothetical protein BGZ65_009472, partial [Modicella reniformis]